MVWVGLHLSYYMVLAFVCMQNNILLSICASISYCQFPFNKRPKSTQYLRAIEELFSLHRQPASIYWFGNPGCYTKHCARMHMVRLIPIQFTGMSLWLAGLELLAYMMQADSRQQQAARLQNHLTLSCHGRVVLWPQHSQLLLNEILWL